LLVARHLKPSTAHNVVRLLSKPRQQRTEMQIGAAEQLATFLWSAASDRYAALWRIAAHGLRRSEVMGCVGRMWMSTPRAFLS
jgi:hypothetical protein